MVRRLRKPLLFSSAETLRQMSRLLAVTGNILAT